VRIRRAKGGHDGSVSDDAWARLADRFVDGHYGSSRGRVRTHVIDHHLREHLAPPPGRIVDVGGGAGHQSIPLARSGYEVTIVDRSPAMLARAERLVASEHPDVAARIALVEAAGEYAPDALDGQRFDAVLCHGVLMYLDDPAELVDALCDLAGDGGLVSIVAKNVEALAVARRYKVTGPAPSLRSTPSARSTGSASTPARIPSTHWLACSRRARSNRSPGTACACSPTAGARAARPATSTTQSWPWSWKPADATPTGASADSSTSWAAADRPTPTPPAEPRTAGDP
jgi:SAM-dependent methyltransferase